MRRIHWLTWHPTPYHEHVFASLAKKPDIDLVVHYLSRALGSHPWKSTFGKGYKFRICQRMTGIDWHILSLALRDREAYFLVGCWNYATSQVLLTLLRVLQRSYGVWTDTPNLTRKRHFIKKQARQSWLRWVFAGATHVLGTGNAALVSLKQMGAPENCLVNFPFYIDLFAYRPPEGDIYNEARPFRFISVGRLENSIKGHDIALRALALSAFRNKIPFEYYIAGTGPDEEQLKSLAEELGLQRVVQFLGWVEPKEMVSIYRQADILIHPSRHHDAFPNAVLEAMASGLVVLASDVSWSAVDRIQHGVNGFIHRAADQDQLSQQIDSLIQTPSLIPQIGKRARATAELWPVERAMVTLRNMFLPHLTIVRL
jgi:glycosyltransferase involved in cell wall biosynthesis